MSILKNIFYNDEEDRQNALYERGQIWKTNNTLV